MELLDLRPGRRALDVGCGPGALTSELVRHLGAANVFAVDPSPTFVAAAASRLPGVDVRQAVVEDLPYVPNTFDVTFAQLVVHFTTDPVRGLTEMGRVTRPGGLVGASVWDFAGGRAPVSAFWTAVRELDPMARDESGLPGARRAHLAALFRSAGLSPCTDTELTVGVPYRSFDDWWEPYTLGVGPAGDHVARLDDDAREAVRRRCSQLLPPSPSTVPATAWCVLAVAGEGPRGSPPRFSRPRGTRRSR